METVEAIEALTWINDHGGLGQVKMDYSMGEGFTDLVDSIAARLGVNVEGLDAQDSEPILMEAIERRMMPEGIEWPKYEDGEPLRFGDEMPDFAHTAYKTVRTVKFYDNGTVTIDNAGGSANVNINLLPGERVKRPAPKVLDADGVEIRVGDEVWDVETGCKRTVRSVNDNETVEFDGHENRGWFGKFLTHRAPVLAADDRPLREGETVWYVSGGEPETVAYTIAANASHPDQVVFKGREDYWPIDAKYLTHERPDSWERLEEDADKEACEYFAHMPCGCETSEMLDETVEKCNAAKARDLVRRARALAERGL